jgi:hypothetical protein
LAGLPFITDSRLTTLSSSTYGIKELGFTAAEEDIILDSYMAGLKYIYILYVASASLNFIISIFVRNTSLRAPKKVIEPESGTETEAETSTAALAEK